MKRLFLCMALASLPACQEDSKTSEDESAMAADENCFTRLHPGRVKGDRLTGLTFQNGRCIGKWKALNKISFQEGVYVASTDVNDFDPSSKSPLYFNDGNVGVKVDGKIVTIGRYTREGPNADFKLKDGIEYRLKIADASGMRDWTLDDAWHFRDREEILFIIPDL